MGPSDLPDEVRASDLGELGSALGGTRTPNLLIRRLRHIVQGHPLWSVRWADIPHLSTSDKVVQRLGSRLAAVTSHENVSDPSAEPLHDAYPSFPAACTASVPGTFRPGRGPGAPPLPPSD